MRLSLLQDLYYISTFEGKLQEDGVSVGKLPDTVRWQRREM